VRLAVNYNQVCPFWHIASLLTLCYNLPTMSQTDDQSVRTRNQRIFNLTLTAVAGQVGCLTLLIILAALFGGLWLDHHFDTSKPIFTILLMITSVPVTLVLMFWVVKATTTRISTGVNHEQINAKEDANSGGES
jgi:hypothetical protein